jgi:aerobic carbon-monoxide dehydrogenase medium subunit
MKAPPFDYCRPETLREAHQLLKEDGARILAGGQSLVPMLNFRLFAPTKLVDINRIAELKRLFISEDEIRIGAMVRQRVLEQSDALAKLCPIFCEAISQIGHIQTRNRGTIGGSLCHLDPSAELSALVLLHDAVLTITSEEGVRKMAADQFIQGAMSAALSPGEVLTEIEWKPWPAGHGYCFVEHARRVGDFALASAGVLVTVDRKRQIERIAICVGGLSDRPTRLLTAERELMGQVLDASSVMNVDSQVSLLPAEGSVHASTLYKRRIAQTLVKRALDIAIARATSSVVGS